jgi:hypothetical protein
MIVWAYTKQKMPKPLQPLGFGHVLNQAKLTGLKGSMPMVIEVHARPPTSGLQVKLQRSKREIETNVNTKFDTKLNEDIP